MKKVVLLGDSIRLLGYGRSTEEALSGEFSVWQPDDNCRFAQYTLRMLFDKQKDIEGADVIHWNNGLWDVFKLFDDGEFTPIDIYIAEMVRIAKLLKARAKVVIFATTTPVNPKYKYISNEDVARYNAAVVPELIKLGVEINDLHSLVSENVEKYICDDLVHLSPDGIVVCKERVESVIRNALSTVD